MTTDQQMVAAIALIPYLALAVVAGKIAWSVQTEETPVPGRKQKKKNLTPRQENIAWARSIFMGLLWPLTLVCLGLYGLGWLVVTALSPMRPKNHDGMSPLNAPQDKLDEADARARELLSKLEEKK